MVVDFDDIDKERFRLPTLGLVLEDFSKILHEGRGFFVLKGLKPESYSREENVIIYLGITSYVAEKRARQNMGGNKLSTCLDIEVKEACTDTPLVHITNVSDVRGHPAETRRPIYSNGAQVRILSNVTNIPPPLIVCSPSMQTSSAIS